MEKIEPGKVRPFEEVLQRGYLEDWLKQREKSNELAKLIEDLEKRFPIQRHYENLDPIASASNHVILLTVGGKPLQIGDLKKLLPQIPDVTDTDQRQWLEEFLEGAAINELLSGYALEKGMDLSDEFSRRYQWALEYHLGQYLLKVQTDHSPLLGEAALREYYENHQGNYLADPAFDLNQIYCDAHIDSASPEGERIRRMRDARLRIEKIRDRILSGERFEDVARQASEDSAAPLGGQLGKVTQGALAPPIEAAASSLNEGDLSEPIQLKQGYALILVKKKYPQQQLSFEEAHPQIMEFVRSQVYQELLDQSWESALKSGEVKVFEEKFRKP